MFENEYLHSSKRIFKSSFFVHRHPTLGNAALLLLLLKAKGPKGHLHYSMHVQIVQKKETYIQNRTNQSQNGFSNG